MRHYAKHPVYIAQHAAVTVAISVCGFGFIGSCCYHYQLLAQKADHRCEIGMSWRKDVFVTGERDGSGLSPLTFLPTGEIEEAQLQPIPHPCPQMDCPP